MPVLYPVGLDVGFCVGRKTGEPGEKPSEQGREPTTNQLNHHYTWPESNPGHIARRRAPSHPSSPVPWVAFHEGGNRCNLILIGLKKSKVLKKHAWSSRHFSGQLIKVIRTNYCSKTREMKTLAQPAMLCRTLNRVLQHSWVIFQWSYRLITTHNTVNIMVFWSLMYDTSEKDTALH